MSELSWEAVGHPVLVVVVVAGLLALLALRPSRMECTRGRRLVLALLRAGVIGVVVILLLRPAVVYRSRQTQTATVLVCVDMSRSMLVADQGNQSRWEQLQQVLRQHQGTLASLARSLQLHFYGVGEKLVPLEFHQGQVQLPAEPQHEQSALGHDLNEALRHHTGEALAAVVLLTDGRSRSTPDRNLPMTTVARRLAQQQVPLLALAFGTSQAGDQLRDVRVERLLAPQRVYVKNELVVDVQLRAVGMAGKELPVRLLFESSPGKMEVVDSLTLRPQQAQEVLRVQLHHVPQQPGTFKLTVQVEPQPGELVTVNNEQSTFVQVSKGGIRVLYLEGRYRPEQKFVRRALAPSPHVHLEVVHIPTLRPQQRPDWVSQLFSEAFEPNKYDVYILGDLDSTVFRTRELQQLREAVGQGAGFLMIGGVQSFGPGGYATGPLGDVLPVEMSPLERQPPGEPVREDVHLQGPIQVLPTAQAAGSFVMLTAPAEKNRQMWQALPRLPGANRFRGVRTGTVLLETPQGEPLLVVSNFGLGRVAALALDSTWRWVLGGYQEVHARFWRQMILWLARREEESSPGVWVRVEPRRVGVGETVQVIAVARDQHGEPVSEAQWQAQLLPPQGDPQAIQLVRQGERMQTPLGPLRQGGEYRVQVQAVHQGKPLGQATARFLVYRRDLELENPAADLPAMHRWASLTPGGKAFPAQQAAELFRLLEQLPNQLAIEVTTRVELWNHPAVAVLFVLLLSLEWFLRRRWGMV